MMSPTKNPKPKNFFSLQTGRLAKSFEGLNSSLAQSTGELRSCKDLANMRKLYLSKQNSVSSDGAKLVQSIVWSIYWVM